MTTRQTARALLPIAALWASCGNEPPKSGDPSIAPSDGVELRLSGRSVGVALTSDLVRLTSSDLAGDQWRGLRVSRFGCATDPSPVEATDPRMLQGSVRGAFAHSAAGVAFSEWYESQDRGIEQGFDIESLPQCTEVDKELVISMSLVGFEATPLDDSERPTAVALRRTPVREDGATLRYDRLEAIDARGRSVPAWLGVSEGTLTIHLDVAGATAPIFVDPIVQDGVLLGQPGSPAGDAIAIDGDTVLLGAPNAVNATGRVFVFQRVDGAWMTRPALSAPGGLAGDKFGVSLAASNGTVVAGAIQYQLMGPNNANGSVYVFQRTPTGWSSGLKLMASDGAAEDVFGASVAILGSTIFVGAVNDDDDGPDSGSVYMFENGPTGWVQTGKLHASDGTANARFGGAMSAEGDTLLVAASSRNTVYVFVRDANNAWAEQQKLTTPDSSWYDRFGFSLGVEGDTAIIGARNHDHNHPNVINGGTYGSAYVFERTGTTWAQQQELIPSDTETATTLYAAFGHSLALSGDSLLVGARDDNGLTGAGYLFYRNASGWLEGPKLVGGIDAPQMGASAALSTDFVALGAPSEHHPGPQFYLTGAAYVFANKKTAGEACAADWECVSGICAAAACCDTNCGTGGGGAGGGSGTGSGGAQATSSTSVSASGSGGASVGTTSSVDTSSGSGVAGGGGASDGSGEETSSGCSCRAGADTGIDGTGLLAFAGALGAAFAVRRRRAA